MLINEFSPFQTSPAFVCKLWNWIEPIVMPIQRTFYMIRLFQVLVNLQPTNIALVAKRSGNPIVHRIVSVCLVHRPEIDRYQFD